MDFIGNILDIILYMDYPYINNDNGSIFTDEDRRFIELYIG
jgi:hypothetical protein